MALPASPDITGMDGRDQPSTRVVVVQNWDHVLRLRLIEGRLDIQACQVHCSSYHSTMSQHGIPFFFPFPVLLYWTHLCDLCFDTRWLAHVMRDRQGDPHGEGLTVTGGWSCGRCTLRGVLVMTVCGSWWCVGEITISLSALVEGQHNPHRHRVLTISLPCTPSPVWLKCRCFQHPPRPTLVRHLGGLVRMSRTSPPGVGRGAPPRFVDCPEAKCAWHPGRHRDQCRLLW